MMKIVIGLAAMFIIFCLIDIRNALNKANELKEKELELLQKQNRIFEVNRL